jgi:hypothetical protein
VPQVALLVLGVERLEPLASERGVQERKSPWALRFLVCRLALIHEPADDASEGVGRRVGSRLWLGQDGREGVGDPIRPRRAVMRVVGLYIRGLGFEHLRTRATKP